MDAIDKEYWNNIYKYISYVIKYLFFEDDQDDREHERFHDELRLEY